MSDSQPMVVAVIVNWNNYEDTADCLRSLRSLEYSNLSPLVVDNGSTDGSGDRLATDFPDVQVEFTARNLGFGGGVNVGVTEALASGARFVWLVNNDMLYSDPDTLTDLVETLEANEDAGVVTPRISRYPETGELWFERGYVDTRSLRAGHHDGTSSVRDLRFRKPSPASFQDGSLLTNDYLPLACALVDRDVFETVGLLPEEYFLYYEDAAYCKRVREAGFSLLTDASIVAHHRVEGSTDRSATSRYYNARNRITFARRHGDPGPIFWLLVVWQFAIEAGYAVFSGDLDAPWPLLQGLIHGVAGKSGRGPYP